jgi:hypothetical protein
MLDHPAAAIGLRCGARWRGGNLASDGHGRGNGNRGARPMLFTLPGGVLRLGQDW